MVRFYIPRLPKKRCPDIIGAGGLGVSPSFIKSPKIGGIEGVDQDYFSNLTL